MRLAGARIRLLQGDNMGTHKSFVVLGGGSMGRRRIRCLLAHGVPASAIRLVDVRQDRRAECLSRHGVESLPDLEQALKWKPDALVVSTPTRFHVECCAAAARANTDFFCEIALSDRLDGTEELAALVRQSGLVAALGIQTPYHPVVQRAKRWLAEPAMGRPLIYHFEWGNYLPNWHPWENYTAFYDPTQFEGVFVEDLGQLYSLLDDSLAELSCRTHKLGDLKIDGCDCFQLLGRTRKGTVVTFQFDLLQDLQQTVYRIVCQNGVIEIRLFPDCRAERYLNATGLSEVYLPPKGYQYEQCYVDEFGAFLQAIEKRTPWHHPLEAGIHVLKCLEAARLSNKEGRLVTV